MNKTEQTFRLVVIRRPVQDNLFEQAGQTKRYTAIATNRSEDIAKTSNKLCAGTTSENSVARTGLESLKSALGWKEFRAASLRPARYFFASVYCHLHGFVTYWNDAFYQPHTKH